LELRRAPAETASRRVAAQLQAMIEDGRLRPGDRLLPERRLAGEMGVSRTAVREALFSLAGLGLLELTTGGAIVRRREVQDVAGAFTAVVASESGSVLELLETREIIEGEAARYAALRAEPADIHRLAVHAQETDDAVRSGRDATDSDTDFHLMLVRCAKNRILGQVFTVLDDAMRHLYGPTRRRMLSRTDLAAEFLIEHWQIIEAVRARDGDRAEAIARQHIRRAMTFVRGG
jgi:GntR family transcriptional repressor for pyruvate dehydrogenase complex